MNDRFPHVLFLYMVDEKSHVAFASLLIDINTFIASGIKTKCAVSQGERRISRHNSENELSGLRYRY